MTTGLTVRRALGSAALSLSRTLPLPPGPTLAWRTRRRSRGAADHRHHRDAHPDAELEVASSITVVTAEEIAARQERTFAEVLKDVPGLNVVQTGGPGGRDLGVHARHQFQSHQGAGRRHRSVSDPSNSTGGV